MKKATETTTPPDGATFWNLLVVVPSTVLQIPFHGGLACLVGKINSLHYKL